MNQEQLTDFIQKELSYDATVRYECEKCGNKPLNYWIDHKSSLAINIASKLGLKNDEQVMRAIEDISYRSTGNAAVDAMQLVEYIDDQIVGIPKQIS